MPSTSFQPILSAAFADYAEETEIDPAGHPFPTSFKPAILLEDKANEFKDYQEGNCKSIDCLKLVVNVIHVFSGVLGEAISSVPIQPAKAVLVGVDVLFAPHRIWVLQAASGVNSSLLRCARWLVRLRRKFPQRPSNPHQSPIDTINVGNKRQHNGRITLFPCSRHQIKTGQVQKFAKKLLGESEIEAVLQRLDRLTQEESRMTTAQTLEVVRCLMNMNDVKVVMNGVVLLDGKAPMDSGIWKALDCERCKQDEAFVIHRFCSVWCGGAKLVPSDQLRSDFRSWLSPPDPSPNYDIARETHQDGTVMWFFQGSVFTEWIAKGSLLWIHGKPGSGKKYSDLSAKSDAYYRVFSQFYLDHDE
ncbi:hypothetical protein EDB86DRAFT_2831496 [Lactarius hatsudake]|nr:hypothetical protein EDB86DRAFT_2831496 [Lactarius hatsudake]